jgi:alpha-N-arabinofuranosidase
VYWVASSTTDGTFFVKLANYGDTADTLELTIDGTTSGTVSTLTGDATAMNTPEDKTAVVPVVTDVTGTNGVFEVTLPAWSVVIVAVS